MRYDEKSLKSAVQTIRDNSFDKDICGEEDLARAFELGNIELEFYEGDIAGYIFYFPVKNCNPDVKRDLRNYVDALSDDKIKKWLERVSLNVETFENDFFKDSKKLNGVDVYFQSMAVHPEFRGIGFGKSLMEQALERVRDGGYKRVFFNSLGENQKLYLDLGFKPILRLEKMFYDGSPGMFMGMELD